VRTGGSAVDSRAKPITPERGWLAREPILNDGFWILNAERALVSLEKSGAALNGIAGGN
jgi:hypothetical protein